MLISDLISIGWLGVRKDKNLNYKFSKNTNFQPFVTNLKEIFLILKSKRVRFVNCDFHEKNNKFFIDIKDKYVREEIEKQSSKIPMLIEKSAYKVLSNKFDLISGTKIFFQNEYFGKLTDFFKKKSYTLLVIERKNGEELMVPFVDKYVDRKDIKKNELFLKNLSELLDI